MTEGVGLEHPVCGVAMAFSNLSRSVWLRPRAAADAAQYCRNCLLLILKFTVYSLPSLGLFLLRTFLASRSSSILHAFALFGTGGKVALPSFYIKAGVLVD
jgi:hypothetical protein